LKQTEETLNSVQKQIALAKT